MTGEPYQERWNAALMNNYGTPALELVKGSGAEVWDSRGRRYLDMVSGVAVNALGHAHPAVVAAVTAQIQQLGHVSNFFVHEPVLRLAERLQGLLEAPDSHVLFCNSGAEANETAFKIARRTGRPHIVAAHNAFHGRTMGALALTGQQPKRAPFEPLPPGVSHVPYGDESALDAAVDGDTAAVVLEPILGEAGVIVPPEGYLAEVERTCREHGAFLVVDEIQTGLGRLGAWWGVDREGVTPDVLLAGKALGGGVVPVGALLATEEAFDRLSRDPLLHNSTFSGSPIAMAAVRAAVEVIEEEGIVERAGALGTVIRDRVAAALHEACPALVRDVRGVGLLIGIEWTVDFLSLDFLLEMLDRRVVIAHSMNAPAVSRLTPPAVLTEADVDLIEEAVRASGAAMVTR